MFTVFVTDLYSDDPSSKTTSYQIPKDTVSIGRSHDNDITIRQTNVSSKHASITKTDQGFFLKDLNSTNGTTVNKNPLQGSIRIFSDDQIEIGGAVIRVTGHPDLERGNASAMPSDFSQDLGLSQPKQPFDDMFGPQGGISSGPKSEPPMGDDFSLSKIAADPFGSSRLSVSLDSLIPSEDGGYKPAQGGGSFDAFPAEGNFEKRDDLFSSKAGNNDLLDKIKALESKMMGEKAPPSAPPERKQEHPSNEDERRRDAIPFPREDEARDALFAPFPDAENDAFSGGGEKSLQGASITIEAMDPVPSGMNKTMHFPKQSITLGRDVDCDICLADSFVSGRHAAVEVQNGRVSIRDTGSRNGTFVNNRKIEGSQALKPKDVVTLGRFRFSAVASDAGSLQASVKPRKTLETSLNQSAPFGRDSSRNKPFQAQESHQAGFPGMAEPYEKVLDGNVVGISLQLYLAKVSIGKALDDLQARPVDPGELRRICRPLSAAIRVLYQVSRAEMDEFVLQEAVDAMIEHCTQTLILIGDTDYYALAQRELIKAHSILFPLSSEGSSFFETTGASVGLSLLSEIGFQGVSRKQACGAKVTLPSPGGDLEGVTIAATQIGASFSRLSCVRALSKTVAEMLFYDDFESLKLMNLVDEACSNAIEHGYGAKEQEHLNLSFVLLTDNRLAVVVEDKGMPFDIEGAEAGDLDGLGIRLMRAFSEEVHFQNMGRRGKRVLMIQPEGARSSELFFGHSAAPENRGRPGADGRHSLETLGPEQAEEISKCVYRAYRYNYYDDLMYHPNALRELLATGKMVAAGALNDAGEMVGLLSISLEDADAQTGFLEHMVVEPSLNSANMASKLTTYLVSVCRERGMTGIMVSMTTSHPYEQVVYGSLGARMTGIMLGRFPGEHEQIDLLGDFSWKSRRQSAVTAYLKPADGAGHQVFLPQKYFDLLQTIYEKLELNREIVPPSGQRGPTLPAVSNIFVDVSGSLGIATLKVWEIGDDLEDIVEAKLTEFSRQPIAAVYLDLPLTSPAVSSVVERLETFHFCFACLIPEDRYGDMLRLQVVKTNVDTGSIHIEDNFGKTVLERIEEERNGHL